MASKSKSRKSYYLLGVMITKMKVTKVSIIIFYFDHMHGININKSNSLSQTYLHICIRIKYKMV